MDAVVVTVVVAFIIYLYFFAAAVAFNKKVTRVFRKPKTATATETWRRERVFQQHNGSAHAL